VDGCLGGWIVVLDLGRGRTRIECVPGVAALLARRDLRLIVMDIPIGLLARGARRCDVEARRRLPRARKSSVFPAPIRPVVDGLAPRLDALGPAPGRRALDALWRAACRIQSAVEGKRVSREVVGILRKIREVDRAMTPARQARVHEGHPEVIFTVMAGGLTPPRKATAEGRAVRLRLLRREFPDLDERLAALDRRSLVADALDAYACLWTARRLARGEALRLPAEAERDARGLRAEIVV
jgi:predicted RNase H-like nuclease